MLLARLLLLAGTLSSLLERSLAKQPARVAVIGGGIAGAVASHRLRTSFNAVEIDVYERNQVGGRVREVQIDGVTVELGASIIWHKNYIVRDLADSLGLQRQDLSSDGLLAVFDGNKLVFEESPWRIITFLRIILRYWFSWFYVRSAPLETFAKFEGIYAFLNNDTTFEQPSKLLQAVGLYDLTQASMFEWLRDSYGDSIDLLASELIGGINRVNYNQGNHELNALAGHVSLLPATEPSVFCIRGGNRQLAVRALEAANVTVRSPAAVSKVERLPGGQFNLELVQQSSSCPEAPTESPQPPQQAGDAGAEHAGPYDAVIMAAPLESSGLAFSGFDMPAIPTRKYQQTVTTIIKGAVRPSFFGLSDMVYGAVMVTDSAQVPWSSLSVVGRSASDNMTLWKLFSREPIPHAWTEMMFEKGYRVMATQAWSTGAYPKFDPPEDYAAWTLTDGLYYTAALENAASAMEIAAIEGCMTALLAAKHIRALASQQQSTGAGGAADVLVQRGQSATVQAVA